MFNTESGLNHINKRIFQAHGNVKINEGDGFKVATVAQMRRVFANLRIKAYRVIGYTEKCKGAIPYEVSIALSRK